jgi:hypothetical protein
MHPAFSTGNPFYNHALSDPSGLAQRLQHPAAPAMHHVRGPQQLPVPPVPSHLYAGQHAVPPMRAMPQYPPVQQPYYIPTVSSGPSHHYAPYHQYPHLNAMGPSVSGHMAAMGPVPKVFSLSVGGWLESDRLSLDRNNWILWSTRVQLELGLQPSAVRFLGGDNPCPSFDMSLDITAPGSTRTPSCGRSYPMCAPSRRRNVLLKRRLPAPCGTRSASVMSIANR